MAEDHEIDLDQVAEKVVQRLVSSLRARSQGSGYHCTGSVFKCGEYDCIAAVHSCKDVYECNIKFTSVASL